MFFVFSETFQEDIRTINAISQVPEFLVE